MSKQGEYYDTLGIRRGSSLDEIRKAYRKLAKKYHPDRMGPEGKQAFQEIQEAYEALRREKDGVSREAPLAEPPREPASSIRVRVSERAPGRAVHATLVVPADIARHGGAVMLEIPARKTRRLAWGAVEVIRTTRKIIVQLPGNIRDNSILSVPNPVPEVRELVLKIRVE